ncbi:hypothetical protein Slala04_52020 [Streptomyces lavendulae subsp. lavendulae]|uniref:hypothetical protein n=1 Tax=Streptomyces TaxID=1883 RepID=UPI000F73FAB9|nr:hypothetical protein [Streptomyces sp. WAC05950]RSS85340.1 hypothetical protein EF904_36210 [Streptomyces sp. WAC05950]GLV93748.1 hypothetical protein Slala04_52020 [Streptomyces lavendulae subsp. lavendulae]
MLTETTGRTAQDLTAELENWRGVDWVSVWDGPPQGGSPEFRAWCERYGWVPETFDRQLNVTTRSGGSWTFSDVLGGHWSPVRSVDHDAWQVRASTAAENGEVLSTAAETWPAYLQAAEAVLGTPTWTGTWDAEDFPEPPEPGYWPDREFRLESRRPYRFAYWKPAGATRGEPYVVLSQSVSFQVWTADMPGGSTISVDVHAPSEFLRARR